MDSRLGRQLLLRCTNVHKLYLANPIDHETWSQVRLGVSLKIVRPTSAPCSIRQRFAYIALIRMSIARDSQVISIVELNTYAVYADESLIAMPSLMRDVDAAQDTTTIQRRCHIYDNKQRRGRRSVACRQSGTRCDAQFDGARVRRAQLTLPFRFDAFMCVTEHPITLRNGSDAVFVMPSASPHVFTSCTSSFWYTTAVRLIDLAHKSAALCTFRSTFIHRISYSFRARI